MQPTLQPGDLVIYRSICDRSAVLQPGCVVIAIHPLQPKQLIIKRLAHHHHGGVALVGDNHQKSSDSRQFGLVDKTKIIGIVEAVIEARFAQNTKQPS